MKKIKENIVHFFDGFCMSLADSVPGVSGGTIAFLLGFYDKFISSLDDLFYEDMKTKKKALIYLIKIGIGWVIGFCASATILSNLFTTKIYIMCSLFLGFILGSFPYIIREEKEVLKNKYINIIYSLIGAVLVALITIIMNKNGININIDKLNIITILYIFACSSVAITAMVLPGISGSTMLLVFGLYIPIMDAVKKFLSFNFSSLPLLIIAALGFVFGAFTIVRIIKIGLKKHRSEIVYFILGMMISSLYSIILGPSSLNMAPLNLDTFNIVAFIVGIVLIVLLECSKKIFKK